jgi:hypothetical protein
MPIITTSWEVETQGPWLPMPKISKMPISTKKVRYRGAYLIIPAMWKAEVG